jgi:recombination protein RecT
MANITNTQPKFSVAISSPGYQKLINDTLGDKEVARRFVAEISTVVSQNAQLQKCEAASILSAGLTAQTLNLPLAPTLGFSYVVPYGDKAQFQIGWKGLVQLAQRSGQFERLGVRPVHEGEYLGQDEFGDDLFKFSHEFDNNKIVGYYAYFKLLNGFKKTLYWTVEQCERHGKKYSKSFNNLWKSSFDAMAEKTVLKLLLNRYAPLSIEMQKAIQADQAVINEDGSYSYVDNPNYVEEKPQGKKTTVKNTIEDVDVDTGEVNEFDSYIPADELAE